MLTRRSEKSRARENAVRIHRVAYWESCLVGTVQLLSPRAPYASSVKTQYNRILHGASDRRHADHVDSATQNPPQPRHLHTESSPPLARGRLNSSTSVSDSLPEICIGLSSMTDPSTFPETPCEVGADVIGAEGVANAIWVVSFDLCELPTFVGSPPNRVVCSMRRISELISVWRAFSLHNVC